MSLDSPANPYLGLMEFSGIHFKPIRLSQVPKIFELLLFFIKEQFLACIFPISILLCLAIFKSQALPIARYDAMLMACLVMQWAMLRFGFETPDELKVICVFHAIGLLMEFFKVNHGSWQYPEFASTKFFGVPLYSGFMYASVASYLCQAWRRFELSFWPLPSRNKNIFLATLIYANFFMNHWLPDMRLAIIALLIFLYWNTWASLRLANQTIKIPAMLGFLAAALCIYMAENIGTFFGAWRYPNQTTVWHWVGFSKLSSWLLLFVVSFVLVLELKRLKESLAES